VRPTIRLVQWLHLSGEEKVLGFQIVVPPMLNILCCDNQLFLMRRKNPSISYIKMKNKGRNATFLENWV
jgi:hypothetical protein